MMSQLDTIIDSFANVEYRSLRHQHDGAPGYGYNNHVKEATETLKRLIAEFGKKNVFLQKQPPNSPDTNCCDLGLWYLLNCRLHERQDEIVRYTGRNSNEVEKSMWAIIEDEFNQINPLQIDIMFEMQKKFLKDIIIQEGGNVISQSHSGIRQLCEFKFRNVQWVPPTTKLSNDDSIILHVKD
jgi:superfamily I DNA/RNA helicase